MEPIPSIQCYTVGQFNSVFQGTLDPGCSTSIMHISMARKINHELTSYATTSLKCGNGSELNTIGTLSTIFKIGHKEIDWTFQVANNVIFEFIIGLDIIKHFGIVVDYQENRFYFKDSPHLQYPLNKGGNHLLMSLTERNSQFQSDSQEKQIEDLIEKYPTVARKDGKIGHTDYAVHKIEAPDSPVFAETPRHY